MTPQLIEAIGLFVVLPICGAAVFWKILDTYNQSITIDGLRVRLTPNAGVTGAELAKRPR